MSKNKKVSISFKTKPMKNKLVFLILIMLAINTTSGQDAAISNDPQNIDKSLITMDNQDLEAITRIANDIIWYGQSAIKITYLDKNLYVDPFKVPSGSPKSDVILITHSHSDHLSEESLRIIYKDDCIIYAPDDCCVKLKEMGFSNCHSIKPGESIKYGNMSVEAVPAYNTEKTNHPKQNKWVGYIITMDGIRIYHPGDTNRVPEMKQLHCDIAFMPLGQTYTMSGVEEAVDAVCDVKASVAVPFHYGMYEGTEEDANLFKKLLESRQVKVIIKERVGGL